MRAYWTRFLAIALAVAACSVSANAQTPAEKASARSMAQQGLEAFGEQRWEDAIDLLQRAENLYHAPTHVLFLARALEKAGKLVEAREFYLSLRREQLEPGAPQAFTDAKASAEKELMALEPRIPYAKISVEGPNAANAKVTIDGTPLSPVFLGVSHPMNPGSYELQASADGARSEPVRLELPEGAKEDVVLELMAGDASVPEANAAATGVPSDDVALDKGRGGPPIAAYSALGVGAVGAVLGVAFTIQRSKKSSDADDLYDGCLASGACGQTEVGEIEDLDSKAASSGTIAVVGYGVGVVGLGTGVTLLLLDHKKKTAANRPRVRPIISATQLGVTGTF